eukprot:13998596-Ditylum_brightwellii.AAC.1
MEKKLRSALVDFENCWCEAWHRSFSVTLESVSSTLLVSDKVNGRIFVNFDPNILVLIKEAKYLSRLGLLVPNNIKLILVREKCFQKSRALLASFIDAYEDVKGSRDILLFKMLRPFWKKLGVTLDQGLTTITWSSSNIDEFIHQASQDVLCLSDAKQAYLMCVGKVTKICNAIKCHETAPFQPKPFSNVRDFILYYE